MKNFYKIMFLNSMMIGTLISISSLSWLMAWIGLEINLLSIIPLMKSIKNKFSSEATIKYFIIQAMASSILLFSIIINYQMKLMSFELSNSISLMMNSALMMKMGAAPFHSWLPEVISGLNWEMIYIMLTWQKIAPLILLIYTIHSPLYISIIIVLSSMISGLQGMNQICLRKILAYSSINHLSWMMAALMNSYIIWLYYFIIYLIINFNIIFIFNKYNIFYIKQTNKIFSSNKKMKFFFMTNFLSLGGLPPFLGFLPKWMTINYLVMNNFYMLSLFMVLLTLYSLYFYLRITFSSFSINMQESLINFQKTYKFFIYFFNFFSLSSLFLCSILTNTF
uniref:NADH-ubiquinone oxidoreductase chain 2 n=1 Tax=Curculionidae sp. 6 AH-2016 TaxID=1903832 RepID=A0A343C2R9_9CUCU|nr:NADH dehydrogenase subunit 2 [Curculionidae sp. 6 AH-2016]